MLKKPVSKGQNHLISCQISYILSSGWCRDGSLYVALEVRMEELF